MVKLDYKNDKPLYEQIIHGVKELIMCGALTRDEMLPSVRDLSVSLTVNPNTVQRAYKVLEAEGVIYSIRGKGSFVADTPDADKKKIESLYVKLREATAELAFYGEDKETLIGVLEKVFEEREDVV